MVSLMTYLVEKVHAFLRRLGESGKKKEEQRHGKGVPEHLSY